MWFGKQPLYFFTLSGRKKIKLRFFIEAQGENQEPRSLSQSSGSTKMKRFIFERSRFQPLSSRAIPNRALLRHKNHFFTAAARTFDKNSKIAPHPSIFQNSEHRMLRRRTFCLSMKLGFTDFDL
jgi:hypothetical protein